jgi:hypothetical protein
MLYFNSCLDGKKLHLQEFESFRGFSSWQPVKIMEHLLTDLARFNCPWIQNHNASLFKGKKATIEIGQYWFIMSLTGIYSLKILIIRLSAIDFKIWSELLQFGPMFDI